jgi:hypothetical protein
MEETMGMEQKVEFGSLSCPPWTEVAVLLARANYPLTMRMIDGQLALPDEVPPDGWSELRVGTRGGMITIRRLPAAVELVTWGNADTAMREAWNALTWAFAACSSGSVLCAEGALSADEFKQQASMPAALALPSEPEA